MPLFNSYLKQIGGGSSSIDLSTDVTGKANQIIVTDDGDDTITLSLQQDYDTGATPILGGLTLEVSGADDVTQTFITADHELNIYLDQSRSNDTLVLAGQTAAKGTNLYVDALDGENAELRLSSGSNHVYFYKNSDDDAYLYNSTQDADLIFQINDGGATKSITWDADVDKLKHSAGLFDFDDDNISTTGKIIASDGIRTKRVVNDVSSVPTDAELDAAFGDPTTVGNGFIGILDDNDAGTASYICWTTGTADEWFYAEGTKATAAVAIVAGNPMGLLLALTYPATP